ncbi:MAG: DUF1080 domain-containing protein [Planctomycetes bacterium]|nr:DUF1080 domain-containing protein [Planctomycetota bacterium]
MEHRCLPLILAVVLLSISGICAPLEAVPSDRPSVGKSFTSLFNGKDLTGWKAEGGARWQVKDGLIVGRQGPNNEAGDLFSKKTFKDFELKVTFKVIWPANTGVWYRYQSAKQAFQADILEYQDPFALTGSLYCTGKMFLEVNTDDALVNRDGWNKFVIRVEGDRHQVFLNGRQVVDVRDSTSGHGCIGFQIHAGDQFEKMRIFIRQVGIREL